MILITQMSAILPAPVLVASKASLWRPAQGLREGEGKVEWGRGGREATSPWADQPEEEWKQDLALRPDPNPHPHPSCSYMGCLDLCQQFCWRRSE